MGRCAVLIDGAYLDNVLEHDFGKLRVDIGRLGSELAGPMERLRTYYYHCTGDSDLVPAIEAAKDAGVVVALYFSPNARHDELLQACDERYEIAQDLIEKIRLPSLPKAAPLRP